MKAAESKGCLDTYQAYADCMEKDLRCEDLHHTDLWICIPETQALTNCTR